MMRRKWAWTMALFVGLAIIQLYPGTAAADKDERDHHGHESHDERENQNRYFSPARNTTHQEQCGACHLAYPPELLPSGSWEKILSDLDNHNGNEVIISEDNLKTIAQFLKSNAADKAKTERAEKIMRNLNGQTPKRITEVPYIRHKHHKIPAEVFKRESIGSHSNCVACHRTAEQGIFDDDNVIIPE